MSFATLFKLVGKALRYSLIRPFKRFNVESRSKKYLGEEAKYFMPAPRAIGALSQQSSSQYPHLEGPSGFKSVAQRRLEAIQRRNRRLLEEEQASGQDGQQGDQKLLVQKAYSETKSDDKVVIETSNKLPVIKTVTLVENPKNDPSGENQIANKAARPLPTSTNLQLSDPAMIWHVAKVPPGRLDLSKFQELMINKLADDQYWTPKQISDTYNIKEEYAENIIKYFKQIKIILSPRVASKLDYVARNDPLYQTYKDTVYFVDPSLRDETDRQFDDTFLPTDELPDDVRKVLSGGQLQQSPDGKLAAIFKRPKPLRIESINRPEFSQIEDSAANRRRLPPPTTSTSSEEPKNDSDGKTQNS